MPYTPPIPLRTFPNMTPLNRLKSALRSAWLPLALLLLALSTVFVFGGDRGYFYRPAGYHNALSSHHLMIAVNVSPEHGFQRFNGWFKDEDGVVRYAPYNRFPPGGYLLMKAATLPASDNPSAQLTSARILILLFFTAAAVLAYLSLSRITSNRWVALTATLLAFSSYYLLYFNDMTANEGMPDLFGVMLTFHGMVVFVQEGRFRQLLVKTCIALLLGWHVFALLLPFVIFGLASDLLRARSAAATSTPPRYYFKLKRAASALFHSRYLLLGAVALAFGLAILTFNFTMEYVALDGETPLTELPSAQSMLKRFGVSGIGRSDPATGWRPFLEEQSRTTLRMFIPYSLLGSLKYYGTVTESPTWLSNRRAVALGITLSAACLIGSLFARPRILFATLASFGFFWALPMRHYTALHEFEGIYYIGLPLVFFTLALLLARRLTNRDGVIAAASAAALLLFAVSSFQMSRVGYNVETDPAARTAVQDLLAMRELTAGEIVIVPRIDDYYGWFSESTRFALGYYLKSLVKHRILSLTAPQGFIVMHERIDSDALLTPQNQYLFLYDAHRLTASLTASYRSAYPSVASGEPLARKDFDVYLEDKTMYYLKEPCEPNDTKASFFLHVFPADFDDLPYPRREHRFDNLDFGFDERGALFDGKCMARVGLPQYDIAGIRIGRLDGDSVAWTVSHVIQGPGLISEYQTIVSREPIARAEFDLYLDEGKLYYLKEPCKRVDTAAGFFLHVVPENENDLPPHRREHGFDNLDFGFDVHGVVFDGKCLAGVDLPQYAIARITTGQFGGADRIWQAEFAPDARE